MTNASALPIGTRLQGGKYTIASVLGQGSFGITYLAKAKMEVAGQLGAMTVEVNVAVKEFFMSDRNGRAGRTVTCSSSDGMYEKYRRKFRNEAIRLSQLHHPHIVKVLEQFEENGTSYYAMEYIDGGSLDQYIRAQGGLSEQEALDAARQIGEALTYMHGRRVLHLDLKPSNIMRHADGRLALIDFGLAKQYDKKGVPESSTNIGGGTPGYAPIEQADYCDGSSFAPTIDVYALGGTLYKMLTAQSPGKASEWMNDGFPADRLAAKGVSPSTTEVIRKAMSPMRKDRWQTVEEMMAALDGEDPDETKVEVVVLPQPEPPKPQPKPQPEHRPEPPHPIDPTPHRSNDKYIFFTIAAAVVVGLIVWFASNKSEPVVEEPEEEEELVQEEHPVVQTTPSPAVSTSTTGKIKDHAYVDLGLSVKWATCNVGASSPEQYGDYYAWGETSTKSFYTEDNSKTYGKSMGDIGGNSTYDAARANWGDSWRLPTYKEMRELIDNCTWTWTTQGGKSGYEVTSKKNGASIFLPAAGRRGTSLANDGQNGGYWTSLLCGTNFGCDLYFDSSNRDTYLSGRYYGYSVRPVSE